MVNHEHVHIQMHVDVVVETQTMMMVTESQTVLTHVVIQRHLTGMQIILVT